MGGRTAYDLMLEEFDVYRWYQREIAGKSNLGWLRNMVHSCTQQLVRQDLHYWLAYALAREDHRYYIVSYPYYAKYQHKGDPDVGLENNTSPNRFQHVDLNPASMARDPNRSQIQGSLSVAHTRILHKVDPLSRHSLPQWLYNTTHFSTPVNSWMKCGRRFHWPQIYPP